MTLPASAPAPRSLDGGASGAHPFYLPSRSDRLFSVFHPAQGEARDVAVLICSPFGWEEVCAHRILRELSQRLAGDGIASLRFSLPGTGDSSGAPGDDDLSGAWFEATSAAARWLREAAGADSVVAVGLGLGGMLAYREASLETTLDGLVLWGVPARGRDLVRQLRAFSRLESAEFYNELEAPAPLADGALEAGGFLLDPDTRGRLEQLDLGVLEAPALSLGALLLERDGTAVDATLASALQATGQDVTLAPGPGYADMTSHPQLALVPDPIFEMMREWLASRSRARSLEPGSPSAEPALSVSHGDRAATEAPYAFAHPDGELAGVLCTPAAPTSVCAVFLNAGAQRRIGPNRMWVETARRWAPRGVASLRLDMLGIGESDGPASPYAQDSSLYGDEMVPRVRAVLDDLQRRGVADRFILVGLCAGSYWALHGGIEDDRVASIMMLNPVAVIWDTGTTAARDLRRVFTDRSWRLIRKNATPKRVKAVLLMLARTPLRVLDRLRARGGGPPAIEQRIDERLEALRASGTRVLAMFSPREGLALDLRRTGRMAMISGWPGVTVRPIPVNDHTIRPVMVQRHVHDELDAELERVLAGPPAHAFE